MSDNYDHIRDSILVTQANKIDEQSKVIKKLYNALNNILELLEVNKEVHSDPKIQQAEKKYEETKNKG